jgi:hypothetical protein
MLWTAIISHATSEAPAPPDDVRYSAQSVKTNKGMFVSVENVIPTGRPTSNAIARVVPAKIGDECIIMEGARGLRLVVLSEELELGQCEEAQTVQSPIGSDLQNLIRSEVSKQVELLRESVV